MGLAFVIGAILIGLVAFPLFLKEKQIDASARSTDRFSGRQRVLDTRAHACRAVHGTGGGEIHPGRKGQIMVQVSKSTGSAAALAHERALYAASVTRRAAAAKRRLVLAVCLAAAALVLAAFALTTMIGWAWCALPLAALVATLGLGARAAKVGRDNDARMEARIDRLRHEAQTREFTFRDSASSRELGEAALESVRQAMHDADEAPRRGRTPAQIRHEARAAVTVHAPAVGLQDSSAAQTEDAPKSVEHEAAKKSVKEEARVVTVEAADKPASDEVAEKLAEKADAAAEVDAVAEVPAKAEAAPKRATIARIEGEHGEVVGVPAAPATRGVSEDATVKPATPMRIPATNSRLRPMIQDTLDLDTKQLIAQQRTEVGTRVPYRPIRPVTPNGVVLTSEEVARGAAVQFNVDDILDRRRASGD